MHDPKHAERRKRQASRAGRHSSTPARGAANIRRQILSMMEEVRREATKPQVAFAYSALAHAAIAATRAELEALDQETVLQRIERIEEIQAEQGL